MSAINNLLAYVLGFDPRDVREEHKRKTEKACEENVKTHKKFRESLEHDPLWDLIRHARKNGTARHDDGN